MTNYATNDNNNELMFSVHINSNSPADIVTYDGEEGNPYLDANSAILAMLELKLIVESAYEFALETGDEEFIEEMDDLIEGWANRIEKKEHSSPKLQTLFNKMAKG